jgi:hypothetical protein
VALEVTETVVRGTVKTIPVRLALTGIHFVDLVVCPVGVLDALQTVCGRWPGAAVTTRVALSSVGCTVRSFPVRMAHTESVRVTVCVLNTLLTVVGIWSVTASADWITATNEDSAVLTCPSIITHTVPGLVTVAVLPAEVTVC